MPSSRCPRAILRTSSGSTVSPSPVATASTKGKRRSSSDPVSPRQLAPPKTTKVSGSTALTRSASASEAAVWWNMLVKPTTDGSRAATSARQRSRNSPARRRTSASSRA